MVKKKINEKINEKRNESLVENDGKKMKTVVKPLLTELLLLEKIEVLVSELIMKVL
jgi:hypothetical protein